MPSCVVPVYCLWIGNEFTFRNQKIKEKEEGFGGGQVKMYNSKVGLLNLFTQLWKYIENILNFTYSGSVLLLLKDAWRRSIDWNVVFFFILKSDFWQQCANLFFPIIFKYTFLIWHLLKWLFWLCSPYVTLCPKYTQTRAEEDVGFWERIVSSKFWEGLYWLKIIAHMLCESILPFCRNRNKASAWKLRV